MFQTNLVAFIFLLVTLLTYSMHQRRRRRICSHVLYSSCLVLLSFAAPASACKPQFHKISDYLEDRISHPVIFLGTVVSVEDKQTGPGLLTQNIEFLTTQWFGGKPQKTIAVRGTIGSFAGTDCLGMGDFSAKVGEHWLIFGQAHEGKVNPDNHLSRRVINGEIPAVLLKTIK